MSGGGGDGPWPETPALVPCELVDFETTVWSPQPSVVLKLQIGQILQVDLEEEGEVRRVAVRADGDLVGSLVGTNVASVIRCLQEKVAFGAEVTAVEGGQVRVRVRPRA